MNVGDRAFYYHSQAKKDTGVVGSTTICTAPFPDPYAIDPASK
jgi:predicted RNA-binding protein with PUA-like domain